jgi:hypothetical protein
MSEKQDWLKKNLAEGKCFVCDGPAARHPYCDACLVKIGIDGLCPECGTPARYSFYCWEHRARIRARRRVRRRAMREACEVERNPAAEERDVLRGVAVSLRMPEGRTLDVVAEMMKLTRDQVEQLLVEEYANAPDLDLR